MLTELLPAMPVLSGPAVEKGLPWLDIMIVRAVAQSRPLGMLHTGPEDVALKRCAEPAVMASITVLQWNKKTR